MLMYPDYNQFMAYKLEGVKRTIFPKNICHKMIGNMWKMEYRLEQHTLIKWVLQYLKLLIKQR